MSYRRRRGGYRRKRRSYRSNRVYARRGGFRM